MREVPAQQTMGVPAGQATGVPEQQAEVNAERQTERVPEQQAERRLMVEKAGPPPQSIGVNPTAVPGGSSRQRQFMKLYQQTKP